MVKYNKCIVFECLMRPSYNFSDEKIPIYCSVHRKEHMINICQTIKQRNVSP